MRLARCLTGKGVCHATIKDDVVHLLSGVPYERIDYTGEQLSLDKVKLLAPCQPGKIIAFGINYAPHAPEINFEIPREPLIFLKPGTAVIGPGEAILIPQMSDQVEYEGELAVVIGRAVKDIDPVLALDSVLGYTCINDVTARDLQRRDVQFTRAKSFDTFAPLGPWIETDLDPAAVKIETFVNNQKRQSANSATMIRPVPELISFVSRIMTLLPGDVIATGTPAGVGRLVPGDVVSITIDKIGTLINKVDNYDKH